MKVIQELGFTPVVIVLETEEETKYLWSALNMAQVTIQRASGLEFPPYIGYNMWVKLNSVYNPRG